MSNIFNTMSDSELLNYAISGLLQEIKEIVKMKNKIDEDERKAKISLWRDRYYEIKRMYDIVKYDEEMEELKLKHPKKIKIFNILIAMERLALAVDSEEALEYWLSDGSGLCYFDDDEIMKIAEGINSIDELNKYYRSFVYSIVRYNNGMGLQERKFEF